MPKQKDWTKVKGMIFNDRCKWKYDVKLDYSGDIDMMLNPAGYVDPIEAAKNALRLATARNTSGVNFYFAELGWMIVVPKPPNGWPIMARY